MNFIAIAIACVVIVAGSYVSHKQPVEPENEKVEVLSTEDTREEKPIDIIEEAQAIESPTNTQTPTLTFTVTPTQIPESNSNNVSRNVDVKVYAKNGEKYVTVNGQEKKLDDKGCYDYQEGGTKIHACVNTD